MLHSRNPRKIVAHLKKLNSLTIKGLAPTCLTELFKNLTALVNLRELKLFGEFYDYFLIESQQEREAAQVAFLQLAEALPNLEIFLISSLDISSTTIVEFIRKACRNFNACQRFSYKKYC